MFAEVTACFVFDAAHRIPTFDAGHKCHRLHGHTWRVEVTVAGSVNPETGVVVDYADIKAAWRAIHEIIDHRYLNEVEGLSVPTTENISAWIWARLIGPLTSPVKSWQLVRLKIAEGADNFSTFYGAA